MEMEGTADPIRIGRAEDAIEVVFIAEELKSNQRLFESECPPSNVESLTKHSSFLSPPLKNVSFFLANATTKMNVSKDRRTPERRAEHSSEHVFLRSPPLFFALFPPLLLPIHLFQTAKRRRRSRTMISSSFSGLRHNLWDENVRRRRRDLDI